MKVEHGNRNGPISIVDIAIEGDITASGITFPQTNNNYQVWLPNSSKGL